MLRTILLALAAGALIYVLRSVRDFRRLLDEAKTSGIPYVVVPFYANSRYYQLVQIIMVPILQRLPKAWTEPWLDFTLDWAWSRRYEPFKTLGTDTFLTVGPGRIIMYTADADVIAQITTRRNDFPKALEVYEMLKIYGSNVVVEEGQRWRHHRKIVSPPFSEKNNHLVWKESLDQASSMARSWFDAGEKRSRVIRTMADDTMRLSLHIISRAGFGVRMEWPGQEKEKNDATNKLENGHTMTYTKALQTVLHRILLVIVTPRLLLGQSAGLLSKFVTAHTILEHLPFAATREAHQAYLEWGQYMSEIFAQKKADVLSEKVGDQLDLMTAMVKGAGVTADPKTQTLSDKEILGNAFVFILAGHETTANSIHFCLVYLALHPGSQRRLQRDLDVTFSGRSPGQWDYDRDAPKLFSNMAGAVMNEELRLVAPVVGVPKSTPRDTPQWLNVGGKKCLVPKYTYIALATPAVHRNPHSWPAGPPKDPNNPIHPTSNLDNDLEEFKPERWILDTEEKRAAANRISRAFSTNDLMAKEADTLDLKIDQAAKAATEFYKPPKGAFIPFSEGYRSCIGKRFAQVELLAVLSVIFTRYSVELAVDDWASEAEVDAMDLHERKRVWTKASDRTEQKLRDDMGSVITLQMRGAHVPLRVVERGSERFNFDGM